MTLIRILWLRFHVTAILDGFSRKLLCLRVHARTPNSRALASLVRHAVKEHGRPRFLITDRGTQFRKHFHAGMKRLGIAHVRGRVRAPYLNGKIERSFSTFRIWWRLVLCGLASRGIQRRLEGYRHWYNHHRPHSAVGGRTPQEAWAAIILPKPVSLRARDQLQVILKVTRQRCRGDPQLPVINIRIRRAA